MNVCVGGTFHPFHKGHKELLRKAVHTAGLNGLVFVGVTSSAMVHKKGRIASYEKRKHAIMQFLTEEYPLQQIVVRQIFDSYGPTLTNDFDAIVVSPETEPTAREINRKRKQLGKKPFHIIVIPFVLCEDGKPISSTRIRQGEIDENGILKMQE